MLARDLQSIVLYDQEGKFVGVRRPSSKLPIEIDGSKIIIEDAIGSSGLDLKVRPWIFISGNQQKKKKTKQKERSRIFLLRLSHDNDNCFSWRIWVIAWLFFLDRPRGSRCLCRIWCAHADNLHQLLGSFTGWHKFFSFSSDFNSWNAAFCI